MIKSKILEVDGGGGWVYKFRKELSRPIEMLREHRKLGALGGWGVAKHYNLRGIIDLDELADYFDCHSIDYVCIPKINQ